jgi:hypothetical protein
MATLTASEVCQNCGQEWPAMFGRHNCNFSRQYVHNKAIISQPGASLLDSVQRLCSRLENEANRRAEGCNLSGEGIPYVYELREVDAVIGYLKHFRAELQSLSEHEHEWSDNDWCLICGADGRA